MVAGAASRGANQGPPPTTTEHPFTLAQLAQVLSALDGERRNPNTRRNAIKAIERAAAQIGLPAEDVLDAADGLLSGRVGAAEWRASLGGGKLADGAHEAARMTAEPPAEPVAEDGGGAPATEPGIVNDSGDEPADAFPMLPTPERARPPHDAGPAPEPTASRRC